MITDFLTADEHRFIVGAYGDTPVLLATKKTKRTKNLFVKIRAIRGFFINHR